MATSHSLVREDVCQSLSDHFRPLETKLDAMQREYRSLYNGLEQECTSSLRDSMESLYNVVNHANKNDKNLIEWHYRSDKVKGVLRLIGFDRRTHTLVENKTAKLKKDVQRVERKCDEASSTFGQSAEAAKHLKGQYLQFSIESVGEFSKEAIQAKKACEEGSKQLESIVREYEAEHHEEEEQADSTSESIKQLKESCDRAKTSRYAWNMSSAGSIALAAATVSGFVCPPLLGATSLFALGAGMAGCGYLYNGRIKDLQSQWEELTRKLAAHESLIQALEDDLKNLDLGRKDNSAKLQHIKKLQDRMGSMRIESQSALDNLRHVQIKWDKLRLKLAAIVEQLEECQFVETRREIVMKLREVISSIHEARRRDIFLLKEEKITKMMRALAEFDEKTEEVLSIAVWDLPGGASNGSM